MTASYETLQLFLAFSLVRQSWVCRCFVAEEPTMSVAKCSSTEQNLTRCTDRKYFDYTAKSNKDQHRFAYKVVAGFKEQTNKSPEEN